MMKQCLILMIHDAKAKNSCSTRFRKMNEVIRLAQCRFNWKKSQNSIVAQALDTSPKRGGQILRCYNDLRNTYRNLTLEFLSSFDYDLYSGPDGYAAFRLFGIEYSFSQKEFGDLLGFETTPDAIPETPMGYFLGKEVEKFWSDISGGGSQDPSMQLSRAIHNPAFRYFQMILAHSFLGRPDVETLLSEEEIFQLFCASQSRPVACGNFLLCGLNGVSRSSE
ncbi:hypothetical protein KIW84_022975 [Lathyrus oleraceus]|uniref:Arabidopsis retrotransposon Orf1 C-terminal domain-containing protein n=1 Tax=Pisum sativum TaxID=3888 RepID=A0A9D4YCJ3_PEA|nr:hypothetical protein KIW84_022975 [Pisum sativum]